MIEPMKRAVEIVRMFNGLEREQLYFLLKKAFPKRNPNLDVDRLLRMKLLFQENSLIRIPYSEINPDMCEAVRILQLFWSKNIVHYCGGNKPVLLKITKLMGKSAVDFYICKDSDISRVNAYDDNSIVIILTDNMQLACPHLCNYVLAVKDDNDRYNFYKNNKNKEEFN